VNIGMNQVYAGDKKGLELMQQRLAKTTSARFDDVKLHLRSRRSRRAEARARRKPRSHRYRTTALPAALVA